MDLSKAIEYIPVTDHINEDREYYRLDGYFIKKDHNKIRGKNEAEMMMRCNNPSIPKLYKNYEEETCYTMVMQFVKGDTLEYQNLTPERKHYIATKVLDIVSYLMSQNIVHGDINTSNIMIYGNQVYLIDFEMAHFGINDYTDMEMLYNRVLRIK
jgi:serine/threonine protein kinase